MSEQKLKIGDLEQEHNELVKNIETVREKRDEHNQITKDLITTIIGLNGKIKEHLKKANEFRSKRDQFNNLAQQAKSNRITTQFALEELRRQLNEIKEKYKDIRPIDHQQQIQIKKLRSAVKKRNMEIETKPDLTLEEEDRLIKQIEDLERKLGELTKGSEAKREYSKIISQFPKYKNQLRKYHEEVLSYSEESQKFH
ncbi:MAG: hypothetical protein ACTSVI_07850, partial [Promethearchaeota archaeon]